MKKAAWVMMLVLVFLLAACSQGTNSGNSGNSGNTPSTPANGSDASATNSQQAAPEPVTLEFNVNASGATLEAYQQLVEAFNAQEEYITVELVAPGDQFGQLMNARMASNDLPDLWTTHGWAVNRYSEYLRPLNDQPWVEQLVEEIVPIISNGEGELFALPFDLDLSGMIYNVTVLEELGIEVPRTWAEFDAAAEQIKAAGLTPIHVGGKESGDVAGFVGRLSASVLVMGGDTNYGPALKDGSFDWANFDAVSERFLGFKSAGYLNVDHLTADKQATYNAMAQNQAAFAFQSNLSIAEIVKVNPDARISMMQIPVASGEPFLISGERNAVGVWKDTPHEEQALAFLNYLAQPENVKTVAESYSLPSAFTNVEVDLGELSEAFKAYENSRVTNHFDREYLPNGMWSTLNAVGPGLLAGDLSPADAAKLMKDDYDRLRAAQ